MTPRPHRPHPPRRRWRGQRGLTLVELLISMLILSFVMLLVSQTVFQVAQVARAAEATTRGLSSRWGQGWVASSMLANLVAPPETQGRPAFEGGRSRIAGYSSQSLDGGQTGVERFTLELRADDREDRTLLVALRSDGVRSEGEASVVAAYAGRVAFAFLDRQGRIQPDWPPTSALEDTAGDLPRAVIVRAEGSDRPLMWYAFSGETTRPRLSSGLFDAATR